VTVPLAVGSVVRAVLGVEDGGRFRALSVATEVRLDRGEAQVAWAPRARPGHEAAIDRALVAR
jgi:hypothetical protein